MGLQLHDLMLNMGRVSGIALVYTTTNEKSLGGCQLGGLEISRRFLLTWIARLGFALSSATVETRTKHGSAQIPFKDDFRL